MGEFDFDDDLGEFYESIGLSTPEIEENWRQTKRSLREGTYPLSKGRLRKEKEGPGDKRDG